MSGSEVVLRLASRWRRRRLLAAACWGLALGLPLAAALATLLELAPPARLLATIAALLLPTLAASYVARRESEGAAAVAAHLDRRVPALAESAGLLLAPGGLAPLQELQRRRVDVALAAEDERRLVALLPARPLRSAVAAAGAGAVLAAALLAIPRARDMGGARVLSAATSAPSTGAAAPAPPLRRLRVTVTPPAYTGRRARSAEALSVRAEEGAAITWRVEAAPAVTAAWLLLDERERLPLDGGAGGFSATRTVREPHLLRLVLAGDAGELWRSPPARIEVIPDRPPSVELLAPATLVERPPHAPGLVTIELAVSDDHGVRDAALLATLATGSDELVEFRDQTLPLAARSQARRQLVRRTLDLAALGLTAGGAELYLRAEVRDNRRPQANVERSPTVVVRLPVERTESADLAAGIPMLVGPELLRSQRQIVVDTERLLAEAPRLAAAEVARRSRALALDQRAVRMRYGVLLGDEFVSGRAVEADEEHGREEDAGGSIADMAGAEVHLHDSAESATYFPEPVRQRLKAMLAAMWEAEGQLAVDAPRTALPHERRALDLLKQVQQASRVYVKKAGVEGAPLDPARRLGGELEGVRDVTGLPARRPPAPVAEAALRTLQELAEGEPGADRNALDAREVAALRPALAARAREGDEAALAALPALDDLAAGRAPRPEAEAALLRSLWSLLPAPDGPTRPAAPGGELWQRYRRQLSEGG